MALPFACSVYDSLDLQSNERGSAGAAGASSTAQPTAGAGGTAANNAAGRGGAGGSTSGGSTTMGAASTGGATAPAMGGEGGTLPTPPAGGEGTSAGEAGAAGAGEAGAGGRPPIAGLIAAYACEGAEGAVLPDTSGHGQNAALVSGNGGAAAAFSFGPGVVGNAITLRASAQAHVRLPRGIVSTLSELTVATWVKVKSSTAFQRIFDFGLDTGTFMYLVSSGSSGTVRFRITSESPNRNQVVEGGAALPLAEWVHVAVTLSEGGVAIYLDGAQIAQQAPAVMRPSDLGDTRNNFIGRSPFASDPYFDGQVDEFQLYGRVLAAAEIRQLAERD